MKVIYKYNLGMNGEIKVIKDNVEKFLHVESQNGYPMVWAEVNLDKDAKTNWEISCFGTGWDLPNEVFDGQYLGTAFDKYGYVWHYYARRIEK